MKDPIAWINVYGKKFSMNELSNEYLLNILQFVCNGGGYDHFVTEEKLIDLFKEAENRNLKHDYSLAKAIEVRKTH